MADISHKDLLESLGNTAAGFTKNLANAVGNFACSLYAKYPGATTFGDLGNYSKGFWDELCSSRPTPPPASPKPTFTGGQCPGVQYRVYYTSVTTSSNPSGAGYELTREVDAAGPITNFTYEYRNDGVGYRAELDSGDQHYAFPQDGGGRGWRTLKSVRVVRLDGQPDNCGDETTNFPIVDIPSSERTINVNVQLRNGDVYNIPITLVPSINNDYGIEFDAGDINVKFDLSGVSFNSIALASTIHNVENNVLDLSQNVTNFAAIAIPFINNSIAYSTSFNLGTFKTKEDGGSSSPADETSDDNLAYVTLDITRKPLNAKTQEGELAQDLVYAGWFQFASEGYYYPRQPIHFSKAVFKAPLGATDYAYTLYEGFEARVVEHRI